MRIFPWRLLLILGLGLVFHIEIEAAPKKKKVTPKSPTLESVSADILETLQKFYPVTSTEMGLHKYDGKLADYSAKSVAAVTIKLRRLLETLQGLKTEHFTIDEKIDYKLIRSNAEIALHNLVDIAWYRRSPQLYAEEAINGIYLLTIAEGQLSLERFDGILSRMRTIPGYLEQAKKNVRSAPGTYVEIAQETVTSGIEFFRELEPVLSARFPARSAEAQRTVAGAIEALKSLLEYLNSMPKSSGNTFSIGRAAFEYKMKHEYFLGYTTDSLLKLGEKLLATAKTQYKDYQSYVDENRQNGQDSIYMPSKFSREDIFGYYEWEIDQVQLFLEEHEIISVPPNIAPLTVRETPPFLRAIIPGIAYHPAGPFDEEPHGYFYVRPIPESLDRKELEARYRYVHRRGFKGSVVHEAFPGHHLQMQIAARHPSEVRRWQANPMMVEGWALFCEEMMYNAGLFGQEDPAQWLAILGGIRFRAARIIADVKLHTGQFTYQQCVEWLWDVLDAESDSEKEYLRKSARKYTLTPTIWMSYLMGKLEIETIRSAYTARLGGQRDDSEFYDALLSQGSIPPTLMWEALELRRSSVQARN